MTFAERQTLGLVSDGDLLMRYETAIEVTKGVLINGYLHDIVLMRVCSSCVILLRERDAGVMRYEFVLRSIRMVLERYPMDHRLKHLYEALGRILGSKA